MTKTDDQQPEAVEEREEEMTAETPLRVVWLVTTGLTVLEPNPLHTDPSMDKICKLVLPERIPLLVSGTGARHWQIAKALEEQIGNVPVILCEVCGTADVASQDNQEMMLADGSQIPIGQFFNVWRLFDIHGFLLGLPNDTLLIASLNFLKLLGCDDPQNSQRGALFQIVMDQDNLHVVEVTDDHSGDVPVKVDVIK